MKKFKQFLEDWESYMDLSRKVKNSEEETPDEILDTESIAQEEEADEVRK